MLAYQSAVRFSKKHYENFPVISLFLPKQLRKHVAVVYQFARQADDIADEGFLSAESRIQNLELYEEQLRACLTGKFANNFWTALKNTIDKFDLTYQHFFDLIFAFKQDVVKNCFKNYEETLDYCKRSANPVGRIMLEFFGVRNSEAVKSSDAICTALQLTNFYQDIEIDYAKNRIYIPQNEMEQFEVKREMFELKQNNANLEQLLKYQIERTKKLFTEGKKLLNHLPWSLKYQIKLTILGGEKILEKIEMNRYRIFGMRPKLGRKDYPSILMRSIFFK